MDEMDFVLLYSCCCCNTWDFCYCALKLFEFGWAAAVRAGQGSTICSGMAVKAAWRWITRAAPFLWTRVEFRNCHLFPAARNNTENQNSVDVLLRNNNIMYPWCPPIQLSPCHSFRHSTSTSSTWASSHATKHNTRPSRAAAGKLRV